MLRLGFIVLRISRAIKAFLFLFYFSVIVMHPKAIISFTLQETFLAARMNFYSYFFVLLHEVQVMFEISCFHWLLLTSQTYIKY